VIRDPSCVIDGSVHPYVDTDVLIKLQQIYMLESYQFKTHCKGDSHHCEMAYIMWPGLVLMTKHRAITCFVTSASQMIFAILEL